jgi:hypothetical protein
MFDYNIGNATMAEETKVGSVAWIKLSGDGTLVLRLISKVDDAGAMTLDPRTYLLARSHALFSSMESVILTAILHGYDLAVTADGADVRAVSIAGRQLPLETQSELRQRVADGPTQEALDELARRFQEYHEAHRRMAEAQQIIRQLESGGGLRRIARGEPT